MATDTTISTIYIQNLEERVKIDVLKETLHHIFSEYGTVIDIIAKSSLKSKGQAFVVFDRPDSAIAAVEDVNGFEIFDKPMRIAMAKTRSDATVKLLGIDDDFEHHRRRRLAEKDKKRAAEAADEQKRLKRPGGPIAGQTDISGTRPAKAARTSALKSTNPSGAATVVPDEYLPPNKILFVQNFPEDYDVDALTSIFGRFEGFREVRLVPGRKGIAFVEYDTEQGAISAKENTAGMSFGKSHVIKVTYQRQ
jgi:RNA recognition motif-containing protein